MPKSFLMAPPSKQLIELFNLHPKAAISEWLELRRALIDAGANVTIATEESDIGRRALLYKKSNDVVKINAEVSYEHVVFDKNKSILWYGFTSTEEFSNKRILDEALDSTDIIVRPLPIERIDTFPSLSHCMNVLPNGTLLWVKSCFAEHAQNVLESFYPRNICVEDVDALNYVCGFVAIGNTLVFPQMSTSLKQKLSMPNNIVEICLSEWILKGLTAKSLVNEILE